MSVSTMCLNNQLLTNLEPQIHGGLTLLSQWRGATLRPPIVCLYQSNASSLH